MWHLAFLYQKMCTWVLVYIPNRLYSKNSLFLHLLNSTKLHQKILAQHFFIPALLCFNTLCKNSMVLSLVRILLGCSLSPIHLKTVENHLKIVLFFLEICKTETFFARFSFLQIIFLAFSFCVYYKTVSIGRQIKSWQNNKITHQPLLLDFNLLFNK